MKSKTVAWICLFVVSLEVAAITISWIVSSIDPMGALRNPFLGEFVRWMFRNMMSLMASNWLVALLLVSMALGSVRGSGLYHTVRKLFTRKTLPKHDLQYRELMGLRLAVVVSVFFFIILVVLTMLPEALLLSATGELFPSPFSSAVVPALCLWLISVSLLFGIVKGSYRSLTDVFSCFFDGISRSAPLIVLLMLSLHCFYVIKMLIK